MLVIWTPGVKTWGPTASAGIVTTQLCPTSVRDWHFMGGLVRISFCSRPPSAPDVMSATWSSPLVPLLTWSKRHPPASRQAKNNQVTFPRELRKYSFWEKLLCSKCWLCVYITQKRKSQGYYIRVLNICESYICWITWCSASQIWHN